MEVKMDDLNEKLKLIAELTREEVGRSEENIKQKIAVPLLEILGHNRNDLDFEYGIGEKRVDIFIKNLPIDCKTIIDTKNYDEDLDNHLEKIGLYAFKEGAILALIINGSEVRIYDPFFRGFSFKDSLLYSINRTELAKESNIDILVNLLSKQNLTNKTVKGFIEKRELEIINAYSKIEDIKKKLDKKKMELLKAEEELIKKTESIQEQIKEIRDKADNIETEKQEEIAVVLESIKLPYMRTAPQQISPQDMQEFRTRNIYSKSTNQIEITLKNLHSSKKYALIRVPRELRYLFPGYKVPFILETDIGEVTTQVTSAPKGVKMGDPEAGQYIQGGLKPWYNKHKELKVGSKLVLEILESKKRYRLNVL